MKSKTSHSINSILLTNAIPIGPQLRDYTARNRDIWTNTNLRSKDQSSDWSISVAVLVTVIETLTVIGLLSSVLSALVAISIHAALIASLYTGLKAKSNNRKPSYDYGLLAICTFFLGPIGSLGALVGILMRRTSDHHSLFVNTPEYLVATQGYSTDTIPSNQHLQIDRFSGPSNDSLGSFSDVMSQGSIQSKQAVIALIATQFNPQFAPALRQALNDAEPAIRVQAATAVARIEADFMQKSIKLNDQYLQDPSDTSTLLALAQHFDRYAFSGLLDPERTMSTRSDALNLYRRYASIFQNDSGVVHEIVRLLVRLGHFQEAISAIDTSKASNQLNISLLSWYAEALFKLQRFDELHLFCVNHRNAFVRSGALQISALSAFALWTDQELERE